MLTYENVIEIILGRQVEDEFDQERIAHKIRQTGALSYMGGRPT